MFLRQIEKTTCCHLFPNKFPIFVSCCICSIYICESVFRQPCWKSGQFSPWNGFGRKHSALPHDYAVGGLLPACTPYRAGVEYDCFFIPTFVQNAQQKSRKRLHTFAFCQCQSILKPGERKCYYENHYTHW